ncbi:DUF58 domain-containing protein [Natrarchaeobaculum aegyptiacum]|uniref:DUF58 domain-containing protein n=1 Tax=Natrarchaeobaculum aegyptiacum TaxID=745377 RepID=A0A2Z2HP99_9EURY|nr:DUF58 domain-containing protein [Natrarchaeobaculum aegyptiacum]ARS88846.1 hypothetical protein B1756_03130 [Natrarchaeobaculum aegyptiacum]
MNATRAAIGLGLLAFLAGLAVAAGTVPLAMDRLAIGGVGLAVLLAALMTLRRRRTGRHLRSTPSPERRSPVPVPAVQPRAVLEEFEPVTDRYDVLGRHVQRGLAALAIAVFTRIDGDSTDAALDRIEDGSWTDDPVAAAFLSPTLEAPDRNLRAKLSSIVGESQFITSVRRVVAAIDAVADRDRRVDGDGSLPACDFFDGSRRFEPWTDTGGLGSARGSSRSRGRRGSDDSHHEPIRTTEDDAELAAGEVVSTGGVRGTDYWTGVGFVALFAVGVGAAASSPPVFLAGVVGIGFAGFARTFEPPKPDLEIERTVHEDELEPGDEVEVTLRVTNRSGRFLPDVRLIDGVPPGLAVVEGASRLGTALRPEETVTLEYTVAVERGSHEFDPTLVLVRDFARSRQREYLVGAETTVHCEPRLRPLPRRVPLRAVTTPYPGRLESVEPGSGTAFHSVRNYRPSDPRSRIDWKRRAKTGELATLEFHEERPARVLLLVDARRTAYCAPDPDGRHAVDRSVEAAGRFAATLLERGNAAGLAAIGPLERDGEQAEPCWLAPATGRDHEQRLREALARHPQLSTEPPALGTRWRYQLLAIRRRLDAQTQVVLCSPLVDARAAAIARQLESHGHLVTVVSPDPTTDGTTSEVAAGLLRRLRIVDLRRAGVPVVDWSDEQGLEEVLASTGARQRTTSGAAIGSTSGGGSR